MIPAAAVLAAAVVTLAGDVATSDFKYRRAIELAGAGHVQFEPDAPMFGHARSDFSDVRIVDARGGEVPWRRADERPASFEQPATVLNSGREGNEAVALLDLGPARAIRDRVVLAVPDEPFVGRAVVFSSDRPTGPFRRLGATGIYDVRGATQSRSTTAVFAPSISRYLLVRATGVTSIEGATVSATPRAPFRVARTAVATRTAERDGDTVVELDFGARNVPIDELRVTASTGRYDRSVTVEVANASRADAWRVVGAGRISRFEGAVPAPLAVGARARYVRVIVENGNDDPLAGLRVEALSRSYALVVEGGHRPPYTLLYGASHVPAPEYEFARIPLPDSNVAGGALTPEQSNPAYMPPGDSRSFFERNDWIVDASLALGALVVGIAGLVALRRRA